MPLTFAERPARNDPEGLLVLHHGRGSDEQDLIGLADVFDPEQRLYVVAPRAPIQLPGSPGYHWYLVPRVGHPDPGSFDRAYHELAEFHDGLFERTGIGPERTVLGGFSMGTVMSYALGLGADRPARPGSSPCQASSRRSRAGSRRSRTETRRRRSSSPTVATTRSYR
jgi:phospholipase/carboxylesterase